MLEKAKIYPESEAIGYISAPEGKGRPITIIGTEPIRSALDAKCLEQALNTRSAPGVDDLVINPDAHAGFGAPIGCVLSSASHIYPGPIGVDIKCSMSLLQLNIPNDALQDRRLRRAVIGEICDRIPTGPGKGSRSVKKGRPVPDEVGRRAITEGASKAVCEALGIPPEWACRCEDSYHRAHDGSADSLLLRLEQLLEDARLRNFSEKMSQLGSYGGGNHFGECNAVSVGVTTRAREMAEAFGLRDGHLSFLSHCGSRGFGNVLAQGQFKSLQQKFAQRNIPLPGGDRELVYAELGSAEADEYLDDMALGANFATVNHLLINTLVLEAFQEVLPGTAGSLVYFISHNIARQELVDGVMKWVHRKGATRAFPAGHPGLAGSMFENTGHPILLPGNPRDGSVVMVAEAGAVRSCYSVNHGAGRAMGRKAAFRSLDQKKVDRELDRYDILSNCRLYPLDEAPDAYKDFREVLKSVEVAGLASTVASLKACFVIKDAAESDG